ncbi:MAG: hypothetical protein JOZ41_17265 [Chloroflexi bacterium]|nr:hypothetical protein [Chloroflexota bacterium]
MTAPQAQRHPRPAPHEGGVGRGLERLASLQQDTPPSVEDLVSGILRLLAESLGVAHALLTRIEGETLECFRVYDPGGMRIAEGDTVPVSDTY